MRASWATFVSSACLQGGSTALRLRKTVTKYTRGGGARLGSAPARQAAVFLSAARRSSRQDSCRSLLGMTTRCLLTARVAGTWHLTPHTSRLTPHTSHLTPHTSHLTPHTSHLTPYTSHITPRTAHLTAHTCLLMTHFLRHPAWSQHQIRHIYRRRSS
jgi:hypothetical protein